MSKMLSLNDLLLLPGFRKQAIDMLSMLARNRASAKATNTLTPEVEQQLQSAIVGLRGFLRATVTCVEPTTDGLGHVVQTAGAPRKNFRWTTHTKSLLGTMPDKDLAAVLGVSRNSVSAARKYIGVGAMSASTLSAEAIDALGTAADRVVAARFNLSRIVVLRARLKRGIAAYGKHS